MSEKPTLKSDVRLLEPLEFDCSTNRPLLQKYGKSEIPVTLLPTMEFDCRPVPGPASSLKLRHLSFLLWYGFELSMIALVIVAAQLLGITFHDQRFHIFEMLTTASLYRCIEMLALTHSRIRRCVQFHDFAVDNGQGRWIAALRKRRDSLLILRAKLLLFTSLCSMSWFVVSLIYLAHFAKTRGLVEGDSALLVNSSLEWIVGALAGMSTAISVFGAFRVSSDGETEEWWLSQ